MLGKYYTIDDLYQFCKTNNFSKFSSRESGGPLIVQTIGQFDAEEESSGLMPVKLKACHTGKNRNKSGISDETMNQCKDTFKGKPILGAIYKTDTGEYEFRSHDMKLVEDEDGNTEIEYIEQPVGAISEVDDPYLEFDEEEQKNYLMVNGRIFSNYSRAGEILQRRKTCKCSVEIAVEEMSYNCDEDYLSIDAFEFLGVTILGYEQDGKTEIQEGMKGSKITIEDFSSKNSMGYENYQDKLIETLNELNTTLKGFNRTTNEEGGECEMENENLETVVTEEAEVVETETQEEEVQETEVQTEEAEVEGTTEEESGSEGEENFTKTFTIEISHEDIKYALYNLIGSYEEEDNDYYYISDVYSDYFYMRGYFENKIYKVGYEVNDDEVKIVGDRQEMFELILTESEKLAIEDMRKNYAALTAERDDLKSFKENTEKAALKAEKDAIFNDSKYDSVRNTKAFKKLVEDAENYSVEDCKTKVEDIYSDFSTYAANFAMSEEAEGASVLKVASEKVSRKKKKPYGGLFEEEE